MSTSTHQAHFDLTHYAMTLRPHLSHMDHRIIDIRGDAQEQP